MPYALERVIRVKPVMFRNRIVRLRAGPIFKVVAQGDVTMNVTVLVTVVTVLVTGVMVLVVQDKVLVLIVLIDVMETLRQDRVVILLVPVREVVMALMQVVDKVLITPAMTELFVLTVTEPVTDIVRAVLLVTVVVFRVKDVTVRVRRAVIPAAKVWETLRVRLVSVATPVTGTVMISVMVVIRVTETVTLRATRVVLCITGQRAKVSAIVV